ncbi:ABC transporter substrate-binding protein [Collinsella intestinalis]|uniref:ABC transporter substrate-binding protein n=1 Tax=Collinsella intestinalis TaxID=147207 RepID=UPI001957DE44|nr:ABC transporter substrate-binding protein [Collinsella intestinalis]MBM6682301.1 ABC transporter substrate-binding protein [Collinsella intestinalis]
MAQINLNRRQFVGSALAASALAALAGCTSNGGTTAGSAGSAPAAAPEVGENYISFYLSEPAYIDPYNAQENQGTAVVRATFDGLVTWDWATNDVVPLAAAELPTVSEDGLTYTFKLREGMKFHNGDPVDAASFKRGWERLADSTMKSPSEIGYHLAPVAGYAEMAAGDADEISGLAAVDDLTFQVTLTDPMADFTAVCCHPGLVPVPQAALDDPAAFLEQPIGNGPFKLDEAWQHNQYIIASKFEDYYGEAPKIDGVYFSIQADPDTAYRELQAGSIDFAMIPTGQIQEAVDQYGLSDDGFTVTPGKQVLTGTELSTYYLVVNLNDPALSDVNVRRAISLAIDRQAIVDTLYEGYREPANSIMPLSIDDNEQNVWEYCKYDPEQAKQILADAGYADGDISVSLSYNGDGGHEDLMSKVQQDLEAVGITVTQDTTEWATYLNNLSDGNYQLARLGWTADYPIMDNFLYPNFFSTADNNYGGYNNPDVDAAMLAARQIQDEEERKAAYRQICHQVGEDMPVIPIMFYAHNYVGTDRLASFNYDSQTIPHFETAELA